MSEHKSSPSSQQSITAFACLLLGCLILVSVKVEANSVQGAAAASAATTTSQSTQTVSGVQTNLIGATQQQQQQQQQVVQQSTNRVASPLDGIGGLVGGVMNMATMPMTTITNTMQSMGLPSIATAPFSAIGSLFQQAGSTYGGK